jgi:hypothetical protein
MRPASSAQALLDDIDSRFAKAEASGSLAQRMRGIVVDN